MPLGCRAFGETLGSTSIGGPIVRPLGRPRVFSAGPKTLPLCPPPWAPLKYPSISPQVTLSYGVFEGKLNIIKLPGPFSHEEDPSRWVWAEVQGGGGDRT